MKIDVILRPEMETPNTRMPLLATNNHLDESDLYINMREWLEKLIRDGMIAD